MAASDLYKPRNYKGFGIVYVNGVDVGNVKAVGLTISTTKNQIKNYRKVNGGNIFSAEKIDAVEASMTLLDFNEANMGIALRATFTELPALAFTAVVKAGIAGRLVQLDRIATFTSVMIEEGAVYRAAVEGVDFEKNAAGIKALVSANYKFNGTYDASTDLQALTKTAQTVEVVCVIENEYIAGEVRIIKLHKFAAAPLAAMAILGDEDAEMELKGEVLADTSKPAGLSQFFVVQTKQVVAV